MYKLMKVIDGQPYEWGNYDTADEAAKAAFDLGRNASVVDMVEVESLIAPSLAKKILQYCTMRGLLYGINALQTMDELDKELTERLEKLSKKDGE